MIQDGDSIRTWDGGMEERTALGSDPLETPYAIDFQARQKALDLGDEWNFEGDAFYGVKSVDIKTGLPDDFTNYPFDGPPNVQITGGEVLENGSTHPRFRPAEVEAIINKAGYITGFKVIDPGAYYGTEPDLIINGEDFSSKVTITIGETLVSYVILSNYSGGAAGLALPINKSAHIMLSGGDVSSSVIAHEIGHNLGLLHAERYITKSELVLSDESDQVEYGNPYSVMGDASIDNNSGDLTIISKVALNSQSIGYTVGSSENVDVLSIDVGSIDSPEILGFKELNVETNNTFRIYRSNYGIPPLQLKEDNFTVELPSETSARMSKLLEDLNSSSFDLEFSGTGEEANGTLSYEANDGVWLLSISSPGRGYVEEPSIRVLNTDNTSLLVLDPTWIKENLATTTMKLQHLWTKIKLASRN